MIKMEQKLQKPYLITICIRIYMNYSLLITQDLWQAHYQILLIIFLKKLIKLNVYMDMTIKNVKRAKLNTEIVKAALNIQTFKII